MSKRQKKYSIPTGTRILFRLTVPLIVLLAFAVRAEIYSWTDEQGARHFSDSPPEHSAGVYVTREIPHDKTADKKHDDAYRQMAEEAQAIASEKQRYREIYVIPERAISPYSKNGLTTPPSGYFYRNSPIGY